MIKSRLKILIAEREIKSISELERLLKESNLGISRNTLSKLSTNKNVNTVSLEFIDKLCIFFDCSINDLLEHHQK